MANDETLSSNLPPRPTRQPPTLDLKAREVAETPEGGGTPEIRDQIREIREQIEGQIRADASAPAEAGETSEAAPAPSSPETAASTDAAAESGEPKAPEAAAAEPAEAAPSAAPPPAPPAAESAPRESAPRKSGGGWFAGLVAGAIAGGAVAAGAVYAVPKYVLPPPPPPPQVDLGPLTGRIAALEARPVINPAADLNALSRRIGEAEQTVKSVQEALAALKAAPAPQAPAAQAPAAQVPAGPSVDPKVVSGLGERIGAVEAGVGRLEGAVDALKSAPPPAPPQALLDTVATLSRGADATQGVLAELQREIGGLKAAQAGLDSAMKTASAAAVAVAQQAQVELRGQVQALQPRLDALDKTVTQASAAANLGRAAASMTVLDALRDAVGSGRAFTTELNAARTVLGARAAALDPLAPAAATGLATPQQLSQRLAEAGAAALAARAPQEAGADSIISRFIASAEGLVKVRPVDSAERIGEEGIGRAAGLIRAGQLDEALAVIARLPAPVQEALKPVTAQIEARRAALATISTLYQQAVATAAGKAP